MRAAFYKFHFSTKSPLDACVLAKVGELYAIKAEVRDHSPKHRRQVRHERSRAIVDTLHV